MEISIQLNDDTVRKMYDFIAIINHKSKSRGKPPINMEDVVKAAINQYFKLFFNDFHTDEHAMYSLACPDYPLKNRLKELLDERGISQNSLARSIGVSTGTLSAIITNKNQMSLDVFLRIFSYLGFPPLDQFLYRDVTEEKAP